MKRLCLAFACFFAFLFRKTLPAAALEVCGVRPGRALPAPAAPMAPAAPKPTAPPDRAPEPGAVAAAGAMQLLGLLQREGRLVDFLMESIDDYPDAQVGAAVRPIHRGCRQALGRTLRLEAVLDGQEEEPVSVAAGFDPARVRIIGNVAGQPPFRGTLKHHGWAARDVTLPPLPEALTAALVVAPAEVEMA
ncbi:MAG: DUF2760 domain-containing protein [Deltaproteobacteria bacterium]|nr:DUF2760 domain-containing protein [Deltaproteobacteria bacterium]